MSYYPEEGVGEYLATHGFGAIEFDAATVWQDWYAGAPEGGGNNAAGKRAAQKLQAALDQLGYGPLTVDGKWGKLSGTALQAFSRQFNTTVNCGAGVCYPTQDAIAAIGVALGSGKTPGRATPIVYDETSPGVYVERDVGAKPKMAGMAMAGVAALVVVAVGALVLGAKKKPPATGAHTPAHAGTATANRGRHRFGREHFTVFAYFGHRIDKGMVKRSLRKIDDGWGTDLRTGEQDVSWTYSTLAGARRAAATLRRQKGVISEITDADGYVVR
jgi:hypothetical protein